jgi:Kdo2-lipid IVA 3' secondary acyltransferase
MLPLLYRHRGDGVALLISSHGDGEIIARVAKGFGYRTVRGSSSRGATGALRGIVRTLDKGIEVGVTPDGPRGPAGTFASGTVIAAFRAQIPIILMAVSADRAWHLGSWDQFMIPKPFARITIVYDEPWVSAAATAREAAAEAPALGARLTALGESARAG